MGTDNSLVLDTWPIVQPGIVPGTFMSELSHDASSSFEGFAGDDLFLIDAEEESLQVYFARILSFY